MLIILSLALAYAIRTISIFLTIIASISISSATELPLWIILIGAALLYVWYRRIVTSLRATGPILSVFAVGGLCGVIQATLDKPIVFKILQSEVHVDMNAITLSVLVLLSIGLLQVALISTTMRDFAQEG